MNQLSGQINQNNHENEIDLYEFWLIIKKKILLITISVITITLLTMIYSFKIPDIYQTTVTILPISNSASQGNLDRLKSLIGLGSSSTSPQIMALLKTYPLAESVVLKNNIVDLLNKNKKINAMDPLYPQLVESAVATLRGMLQFSTDLDTNTIKVTAESEDKNIVADFANWYVQGLQDSINHNVLTVTKNNRIFIQEQLAKNKKKLLEVSKEVSSFYLNKNISSVESKIDVSIDFNDPMNFDLLQTIEENLDEKINKNEENVKIVRDVPQHIYLQYLNTEKELFENANLLLAQQYETAKIDEIKNGISFQIIDPARPPKGPYKPNRKIIFILGFSVSLFFSIFGVLLLEYLKRLMTIPPKTVPVETSKVVV